MTARANWNRPVEVVTAVPKLVEEKSEQGKVIVSKVTDIETAVATAHVDLVHRVEDVTAFNNLVEKRYEQV